MFRFFLLLVAVATGLTATYYETIGWWTLAVRWVTENGIFTMPVSTSFTYERSWEHIGIGFGLYLVAGILAWFAME